MTGNGLIEVARSFSYKLNLGNYESRDFFCSQKAECKPEEAEEVSERLHKFCRAQVERDMRQYVTERRAAIAARKAAQPPKAS